MPANDESPEMAANGQGNANADPYAPTVWSRRYEDLTCPSGQTCLVRKVGIEQLIADGAIDDLDTLTKFVSKQHIEPKAKSVKKSRSGNPAVAAQQKDTAKQAVDILGGASPDDVRRIFKLQDDVAMAAVVKPKLHPSVPDDEREAGKVYVDDVDAVDKSFIMNYVFAGVKDIEQFRRELAANAAALGNVEDVEMSSK
jgi:hypothetical protein